ncbi:MAG: hypothetical protein A2Z18_00235 [Armatimonadetes bacterium RBG_16_58_9]|nr:MAG: hypothetical protein A2Z18_00235 [Armatimonadetes bacterium RBG_16_58_9]
MGTITHIPAELQKKVDQEIEPGERILWIDMPIPKSWTAGSTVAFLCGVPWTAFWTCGAWDVQWERFNPNWSKWYFLIGAVLCILVGLVFLTMPIWAYIAARQTVYVITDRRAITFEGKWRTRIWSYPPSTLQGFSVREKKDGTGDIIMPVAPDGNRYLGGVGFMNIRNLREAEVLLKQLAEQVQPPTNRQ